MIHDSHPCTLGEGAFWHPGREQFFWTDILNARLHCAGRYWQFDEMISAMGWVDRNRLIIGADTRLLVFDLETETTTGLCDLEADNPLTRSNDGRADPMGGFWISTMGRDAQRNAGAIYRWYRGELRRLFAPLTIPNAICFAPDGQTACFADTATGRVMRVALDGQGWPVAQPEVMLDLSHEGLNPDGAVIDADGVFWVAQWGAGRVAAYSPEGAFLRAVHFPATQISCPAFGGVDLSDLYATSARQGLSHPTPTDGATFCAPGIAKGQREHRVTL